MSDQRPTKMPEERIDPALLQRLFNKRVTEATQPDWIPGAVKHVSKPYQIRPLRERPEQDVGAFERTATPKARPEFAPATEQLASGEIELGATAVTCRTQLASAISAKAHTAMRASLRVLFRQPLRF